MSTSTHLLKRFSRRVASGFLLLIACGFLFSCAFFKSSETDDLLAKYPFELDLAGTAFRPGEMVTVRVTLTNATGRAVTIIPPQSLQAKADSNLNFYLLIPDSERLLRRAPIVFPKNPPETPETLEPGESLSRQFAFTNLSEQRGAFQLQAHYRMSLMQEDEDARQEMLISEPVAVEVEGDRAFRRDRNGLIVREDAVRIARERSGSAVKEVWAFLRENEAGLLDWWVTLEKMPHDVGPGESRREACYVSPYGGFVIENREAPVYVPEEDEAAENS